MGSKAVLGSLAALAAVALVWIAVDREDGGSPRGRPSSGAEPAPELVLEHPHVAEPAPRRDAPVRESLALAAPVSAPAAAPDARPSDPLLAWLGGRVLDTARAPLVDVEVVVFRPDASHLTMLDVEARRRPREVARGRTDTAGRFAFELERGIPYDVAARAAEHGDEILPQRYAGEELEIVLGAGFRVHGTVTRERDGAPIADARVRVFDENGGGGERVTTTAADGSYRLRFAFDEAVLEVTPREQMGSGWIRLAPGAEGSVRQDVVLADGIEVRGRVVDAATGAPLAGAVVGEGWTYRRSAETDARGEYVLRGFGTSGIQELYARARGYGQTQLATLPAAVDGVMRADFALSRGRSVRGRVLDSAHRPLAGAYVAAVASEDSSEGQRTDWISGRTDAAGRFELGGLTPELRHALLAGADGHATATYDFPAQELELAVLELEDVVLAPPAVLAGSVRDESGTPLPGMTVALRGSNRDRGRWRAESELQPAGEWYVDFRKTTTDAHGRFWFGALAEGDYRVHAGRSGQPDGPDVGLTLAAGAILDDFELLYPRGEELAGKVVDEQGRGLEGVYVTASLRVSREGLRPGGQHGTASARTDASGAFALRGLPPGTYRLDVFTSSEVASDPEAPWLSTSLEAESGRDALEILLPRGATIRGRAVDLSGAALVGYTILARGVTTLDTPTTTTEDDGSFALEVPAGTVWDLEVRGPWQTSHFETVLHVEPGVPAPAHGVELRVDPEAPRGA